MADLLSAAALDRPEIEALMSQADATASGAAPYHEHPGATVGLMFFQDSLRTRVGFAAAAARMRSTGLEVLKGKQVASMSSAESDMDAARCAGAWCDVVCIRHGDASFVASLADMIDAPVINCGNGDDEHPTQALVDLWTIRARLGGIDGARIAVVGDLRAMRAAHSLVLLLALYGDVTVRAIAPPGLGLPDRYTSQVSPAGLRLEQTDTLDLDGIDLVYVAGLPEGSGAQSSTPLVRAAFTITSELLASSPGVGSVLCPLPRIDEIAPDVDALPQAHYFEQNATAVHMRAALLHRALSGGL